MQRQRQHVGQQLTTHRGIKLTHGNTVTYPPHIKFGFETGTCRGCLVSHVPDFRSQMLTTAKLTPGLLTSMPPTSPVAVQHRCWALHAAVLHASSLHTNTRYPA